MAWGGICSRRWVQRNKYQERATGSLAGQAEVEHVFSTSGGLPSWLAVCVVVSQLGEAGATWQPAGLGEVQKLDSAA